MRPRRNWPEAAEAAFPLLLESASRYTGRKPWGRGDQSAYNRALRAGLLDRIAEELGWGGPERWPDRPAPLRALLLERARPFGRLSRWLEGDPFRARTRR